MSPEALTYEWFAHPYEFMSECAKKYGDIFTVRYSHIGTQVIVSRPDHLKAVFTGNHHQLCAGKSNQILGEIMGKNSPMLLDGDQHLQRRKTMLPPFHLAQVKKLAIPMDQVITELTSHWVDGDIVVMRTVMLEISLRIILRAVFGIPDDSFMKRLSEIIQRFVMINGTQSVLTNTNREPTRSSGMQNVWKKELQAASKRVNSELYAYIDRRRVECGREKASVDVLGMLLNTVEEDGRPLTNEVIRDHLMTLFIAGHETSASSLAWAMHWLLRTPTSYERLKTEIDNTPGYDGEYLEAFCNETLRMNPPISEVSRYLQTPMRIDDYHLPAGISISPSIYLAHHRPETFAFPDEFRPERFLERKYSPYEYLPFGGGSRRCIGNNFALLEMRLVLANLLRTFRFESAEGPSPQPMRRAILVAPSGGGRMRVWRRRKT